MTFLSLSMDYSKFLRWLYDQQRGLERESYEEQIYGC
jgi:hypothetical protein